MSDPARYRRAYPQDGVFSVETMADGWPLRRFDWPAAGEPRGSILFLTGRGDLFEKSLEALAHWRAQGCAITTIDWRGQGGSGRLGHDASTGHIDDFATWIADLALVWRRWQTKAPGPHVVIGHSMGGHLALRGVIDGAVKPSALVLSAPMLGFTTGKAPVGLVAGLIKLVARLFPKRRAWPDNERPSAPGIARQSFLTHDDSRYADEVWWRDTHPEIVLGPPSLGWLAAAYASTQYVADRQRLSQVQLPVLLLGTDGDKLVSPDAIRDVAAKLPNAKLHIYPTTVGHEILREVDGVRNDVIARMDAFLATAAPAP